MSQHGGGRARDVRVGLGSRKILDRVDLVVSEHEQSSHEFIFGEEDIAFEDAECVFLLFVVPVLRPFDVDVESLASDSPPLEELVGAGEDLHQPVKSLS